MLAGSVSGKDHTSWVRDSGLLAAFMVVGGERAGSCLFYKGMNSFAEESTFMTYLLPQGLPPKTITWRVRAAIYQF